MSARASTDEPVGPGLLVIAERGIGDALTLLPSLRGLRAARPSLRIDLLTPGLSPLAANLRDTATVVDHQPLAALSAAERLSWLRERNYEWVWNTEAERGGWTQALRGCTNPQWRTAPPQRTWGGRHVGRVRLEQLRELFPDLRTPGTIEFSLTPEQEIVRRAFRSEVGSGATLVAIHPEAGDPSREWPAAKFRALADALAARPGVAVVGFAGGADTASSPLGDKARRTVREPLDRAVAKLATCDFFIGNDSGFYHLAYALGLRVVGIYRSLRSARRWGYPSPRARRVFPFVPRALGRDWTRWISVARVLRAARRVGLGDIASPLQRR